MNVDGVRNGIVLDHIAAGKSMEIYRLLNLDQLSCSVAVLQNVQSKKYGIKDMIKIDEMIDINLDIIGYMPKKGQRSTCTPFTSAMTTPAMIPPMPAQRKRLSPSPSS